jgi:MFS family permease
LSPAPGDSPRLFYGWVMVGLAFLTQFVTTGWIFYAFSVSLTALADEFTAGRRTPIMFVHPLMSFVGIAITPSLGRFIGLGYSRGIMTAAALSTGVGLLLIAQAQTLWQFQLAFAILLSFGGVGLGNLVCVPLVANWFEAKRARALGLSQIGASLGGAVMSPVVGLLVADFGWRQAYQFLGLSALCVAPIVWLLLVARPEDRGLRPDGVSAPGAASGSHTRDLAPLVTPREALTDRNLWLIALATGLAFIGSSSLLNHIVSFGFDAGFNASRAASLASILSGSAAVGKPLFGYLCDRTGEVKAFVISCLSFGLGVLLLGQLDGYEQVAGCAALAGVSMGGLLPVSSALMARAFGRDQMGPKMGVAMPIVTGVQLGGPLAMAAIYDATGSYDLAFYAIAGCLVVSSLLVRRVKLQDAS